MADPMTLAQLLRGPVNTLTMANQGQTLGGLLPNPTQNSLAQLLRQQNPESGSNAWVQQHKDRQVPTNDFNAINQQIGGQYGRGNIDLNNRIPYVWPGQNDNYSSLESISVNIGGKEVLIPTITHNGQRLTQDQAIQQYRMTGKHLGEFKTPEEATQHAIALERRQQAYYENGPGKFILDQAYKPKPMQGDQ